MLPVEVPLSQLGPPVLLLQLLLPPTSAFFPNIWSLLAAPGSVTHQDLTEEAALNVTLELFLEQPPPGRPHLHLEDYRVSNPVSSLTLRFYSSPGFLRGPLLRGGSPLTCSFPHSSLCNSGPEILSLPPPPSLGKVCTKGDVVAYTGNPGT